MTDRGTWVKGGHVGGYLGVTEGQQDGCQAGVRRGGLMWVGGVRVRVRVRVRYGMLNLPPPHPNRPHQDPSLNPIPPPHPPSSPGLDVVPVAEVGPVRAAEVHLAAVEPRLPPEWPDAGDSLSHQVQDKDGVVGREGHVRGGGVAVEHHAPGLKIQARAGLVGGRVRGWVRV